jgi:RNA polymerase sigma-70 factor (ECF subfamily)
MGASKSYIQERLEAGDIKAFEMLYNKQYNSLCHFAQRFVFDLDTAREIVQEVFVCIWVKRASIPSKISLETYLYTSVRNKSLDYLKHINIEREYEKRRFREIQEFSNTSQNIINNPLDGMIAEEFEHAIRTAIEKLPVKCREIFQLSRHQGLKYREIAEKLNISVKTVETQMSRAIHALRKELSDFLIL